jgi:hypothetical protein
MRYSILELQAFLNQLYGGRPLVVVPYGYTATFTGITANTSQTQTLSITANADFVLTHIKARTSEATLQTVSNKRAPYARILITDSGSNEQFTNSAANLESYATNGNTEQGLLPYPRFIGGRTALTITVNEYQGVATTESIDIFLEGVLVRTYSGQ